MKIADRIEMIAALHQKFSEVVSVGNGQRRRLARKIFHLQYNTIEVSFKTTIQQLLDIRRGGQVESCDRMANCRVT
jgi:hypothetical protein